MLGGKLPGCIANDVGAGMVSQARHGKARR
jgi:hypothetical protein